MTARSASNSAFSDAISKNFGIMRNLQPFLSESGQLHNLSKSTHKELLNGGFEMLPVDCDVLVMQMLQNRGPDAGALLRTFHMTMTRPDAKLEVRRLPKLPRRVTVNADEERKFIDRPCSERIPFEAAAWHMYQLASFAAKWIAERSTAPIRRGTGIYLNQGHCFAQEAAQGNEGSAISLKAHRHPHSQGIPLIAPMSPALSELGATGFEIFFYADFDPPNQLPLSPTEVPEPTEPTEPTEAIEERSFVAVEVADDSSSQASLSSTEEVAEEHRDAAEAVEQGGADQYEPGTVFVTLWTASGSQKATLRRRKDGSFSLAWRSVNRLQEETRDALTARFKASFGAPLSNIFLTKKPCQMLLSWQYSRPPSGAPTLLRANSFVYWRGPVPYHATRVQFQARSSRWWIQWLQSLA